MSHSKALEGLVHGFELQDMWRADTARTVFTHYSLMVASRIDRIYTTKNLIDKLIGVDTVAAAFTDHLSVLMRLRRCPHRATGQEILEDEHFLS